VRAIDGAPGLRLGVQIERIRPGHPEQNGRHERMHLTLKKEATQPAAPNFLQQPEKFDDFIDEYNQERPHQALGMNFPAELYTRSRRPYLVLEDLDYPLHDKAVTVTQCGRACFKRKKVHLSTVFAGQNVGIKQVDDKICLVSFMQYDLGFFDEETCRLGSAENHFGAKVLPMSPVSTVTHVSGMDPVSAGAPGGTRTPDPQVRSLRDPIPENANKSVSCEVLTDLQGGHRRSGAARGGHEVSDCVASAKRTRCGLDSRRLYH